MSSINYSKWDHIEISDDEDDTHPNIDTPSLFRWRHQARVERMEQDKQNKDELEKKKKDAETQKHEISAKLKEAEEKAASEELSKLKLQMSEIQRQEEEFKQKEKEIREKEKKTPWNIDTICREGKSKTIINTAPSRKEENLSEDEKWERQMKFQEEHKKEIEKFGILQKYDDSAKYLKEHPYLACEDTANYMVIWCINLEVEEKHELMKHVAHQTIVMQFILELAKTLDRDPRACVNAFFNRISMAEKTYKDAFTDELNSFKERVKQRAKARIDEAVKQVEEEERQKRIGPGGLDPQEVFETLPKELQDCFESKDVAMLQEAVGKMDKDEAEYHIKRCIDSGLWVPGGGEDTEATSEEQANGAESSEQVKDEDYATVGETADKVKENGSEV